MEDFDDIKMHGTTIKKTIILCKTLLYGENSRQEITLLCN
jgi:hypothetical protein